MDIVKRHLFPIYLIKKSKYLPYIKYVKQDISPKIYAAAAARFVDIWVWRGTESSGTTARIYNIQSMETF